MRHILRAVLGPALASAVAVLAALAALPSAAQAQDSYRIQPGDTLDVTVLEDPSLNRQVLVGPDGRISLPLAGTVRAGGQTIETVVKNIAQRLASNFAVEPNVFVALASLAPEMPPSAADLYQIYVLGQVGAPGRVQIEPGTTVLQAISLAGGLGRFAATKRIQIRRTDPKTGQQQLYLFNFNAIERGGSINSSLAMRDGDVIIVPERRLFE